MSINCPNGMPYTVKAGDSFFLIARTFGISLDALIAANPGIDPDRLFIGQVICVPTTTTPTQACPLLRRGSKGPAVIELQTLLRNQGFDPGPIDGDFGPLTEAAVKAFQRSKGLVQDGIVGIATWTALGVNCTPTPPPTTCPIGTFSYTIKAGDTFYTLAQRYNTTVDAIQRANPTVNPNNLQVGQVICIPETTPSTCPVGTFPYKILAGDTFYNLAQRYNTTVSAIQRANPTVNPNNLQVGQIICIPRA